MVPADHWPLPATSSLTISYLKVNLQAFREEFNLWLVPRYLAWLGEAWIRELLTIPYSSQG